jgi:hypothetical protein
LDQDSIRSVDSDPYSESGSGYRRAKMNHKRRKKIQKFHVLNLDPGGPKTCGSGGSESATLEHLLQSSNVKSQKK